MVETARRIARPLVAERRSPSIWREIWQKRSVYIFFLPTLVLLAIFNYYPIFLAFYRSFFKWDGVNATFIGLGHFARMIEDPYVQAAVPNVVILAVVGVAHSLTLPVIAAEAIFNLRWARGRYLYRVAIVIPMVVPWIVVMMVWRFIYNHPYGIISRTLEMVALGNLGRAWLGDPDTALWAIAGLGFPWIAGFNTLIFLAGLDNISQDILDSCEVDGAIGLRRYLSIDLPLIAGQIKLVLVLAMISQVQAFQSILLLTRGGPGTTTMVPGMIMYRNAFEYGDMGYASAIGLVMFVVILALTMLNMRYVRSSTEYEGR